MSLQNKNKKTKKKNSNLKRKTKKIKMCFDIRLEEKKNETLVFSPHFRLKGLRGIHNDIK